MASSVSAHYDMRIRFAASIQHPLVFESLEDKLRYVASGIDRAVELMRWVRDYDGSSDGSCAALAGKAVDLMEGIKSMMGMSILGHTVYGQEMCGLTSELNEVHVAAKRIAGKVDDEIENLGKQNVRDLCLITLGFLITPLALGGAYNYRLSHAGGDKQLTMGLSVLILISTLLTNFFGVTWTRREDARKKILIDLEQQRKFAAWIGRASEMLYNDVNNFIVPHIPPPSEPVTPSDVN